MAYANNFYYGYNYPGTYDDPSNTGRYSGLSWTYTPTTTLGQWGTTRDDDWELWKVIRKEIERVSPPEQEPKPFGKYKIKHR